MNQIRKQLGQSAVFAFLIFAFALASAHAQTETPPPPSSPKSVNIPAVQQKKLPNGLTVVVVERKSSPIVTAQLLVKAGASAENPDKAGLANLTADMLTKGTKTRSATQIADDMAFLGTELNTGAGWNSSTISFTATPDNLPKALAIMADVVLNPSFKQEELDLLKSQALDGLKYNLKQPGFVANYVASKYSFGEHPAGGTPDTISAITTADIQQFHGENYKSQTSVLIFAGDISLESAVALAQKTFGGFPQIKGSLVPRAIARGISGSGPLPAFRRLLVVDLPNSGQAAVNYYHAILGLGRNDERYFPASVLNSVLGGGYSSRLNYEIRIKRGLSYGAGSSFAWRPDTTNFSTRTQTKNESAAEVLELVSAELKRLTTNAVASDELVPRKSTLTGNFGRSLETTNGLAAAVSELYSFDIPANEINNYVTGVNAVTDAQISQFALQNLLFGDVIIVGDYSIFKDDLAKRFPDVKVDVIKADDLDLSKDTLRK
jgi:zinc protease